MSEPTKRSGIKAIGDPLPGGRQFASFTIVNNQYSADICAVATDGTAWYLEMIRSTWEPCGKWEQLMPLPPTKDS